MLVRTAYAEERLQLLRRIRAEAQGTPVADLFRPDARALRFRLGTSLADLRIPFRVDGSFRELWETAAVDAYLLACQRHKASLSQAELDKLIVVEGYDPSALRPLSFSPPVSVNREVVKRAFVESMEGHTGLDAGLVASFLGTERPGRALAAALHAVLLKARSEAARTDTGEPTVWLAALMLRTVIEQTFHLTRNGPLGEPHSRFVRAGVGVLLYEATTLAFREAGMARDALGAPPSATPPPRPADPREARLALLASSAMGLLPFLGSRSGLPQSGVLAYGIQFDRLPKRLDDAVARLAHGEDPDTLTRDFTQALQRDPEERRRAERAAALAAIRANARALARVLEISRGFSFSVPGEGPLAQALLSREYIEQVFSSETRRKELARVAREAVKLAPTDAARQRLDALAFAARDFRDDEPAGWLGAADARQHAAQAMVALATDVYLDRLAGQAAQLLLERTGGEVEGGESAEYEQGRVYLLGHEERPFLAARLAPPQVAHLFVDVKDFTRRTAFLKESVIADFLQREFYGPILAAASGLDPGARLPTAPRSIALNNLLGDAISFSGDVVALMRLAREIRAVLRSYAQRLEQEASQEAIYQRVRELESTHRLRREAMERAVRELVARAPFVEPGLSQSMLARARQTRTELLRQEALFRAEVARATGERLEAGIFISFGTAPEVARFDDPCFGALKVAIAEKINESARGTARSGGVRDKADALLTRARRAAGRELELPFGVLVDTPPSLPLGAEQALAAEDLLARGELEPAERMLAELVRAAVARLSEREHGGEIYNSGAALSEEALHAYLEARGSELHAVRVEMQVEALHPYLQQRFFFPSPDLVMVAGLHPSTHTLGELFVFQGRVQFKGFEATGGLGVYEIIDPGEAFFQLLATHHAPAWARGEGGAITAGAA